MLFQMHLLRYQDLHRENTMPLKRFISLVSCNKNQGNYIYSGYEGLMEFYLPGPTTLITYRKLRYQWPLFYYVKSVLCQCGSKIQI